MTQAQLPKTTLESIFSIKELKTFNTAKKTWLGITKDTLKMLSKVASIGEALEMLYNRGTEKGLKKNQIAQMASEHFQGLSDVDRSVYKKINRLHHEIELYVRDMNIQSDNPRYLLNSFIKAQKEDCKACAEIEAERAVLRSPWLANPVNPVQATVRKPTSETPEALKTPAKQDKEPANVVSSCKDVCSAVRKSVTKGLLSSQDLAQVERQLTITLALIHSIDESAQEVINQ